MADAHKLLLSMNTFPTITKACTLAKKNQSLQHFVLRNKCLEREFDRCSYHCECDEEVGSVMSFHNLDLLE